MTKEEDKKTLEDLKDVVEEAAKENAPAEASDESKEEESGKSDGDSGVVEIPQPVIDAQGRAYGTGRRKGAVACVWVKPGSGKIEINGKDQTVYFARATQRLIINQPFEIAERTGQFDVFATVSGGGLSGQAGAVKHGISRALEKYEPALRPVLKKAGFLTRDARVVERKKYGLRKARRGMQWAKR